MRKRIGSGQSFAVIQQTTSWLLAVGDGMLIWFASSIDKFTENGHLNYRWLYLATIIVLAVAYACCMSAKLLCLVRTFLVNFAFEGLETFPAKARLRNDEDEERKKEWEKVAERSSFLYRHGHNLVSPALWLTVTGAIMLLAGIVAVAVYFVLHVGLG